MKQQDITVTLELGMVGTVLFYTVLALAALLVGSALTGLALYGWGWTAHWPGYACELSAYALGVTIIVALVLFVYKLTRR